MLGVAELKVGHSVYFQSQPGNSNKQQKEAEEATTGRDRQSDGSDTGRR